MANKKGSRTTGVVSESARKRAAEAELEKNAEGVERAEAEANAAEAEAEVMEHAKELQRTGMRGPEALKQARQMRNKK